MKTKLLLLMLNMAFLFSCEKDNNIAVPNLYIQEVITIDVTYITKTSAVINGRIITSSEFQIFARGFCWSMEPVPTIKDNRSINGYGLGYFTETLTDLKSGSTYYVRAYAINENGVGYGEEIVFTCL
jgi:hypothetical protein